MPSSFFFFSSFLVMAASSLEMAPSATAKIENRFPAFARLLIASLTTRIS